MSAPEVVMLRQQLRDLQEKVRGLLNERLRLEFALEVKLALVETLEQVIKETADLRGRA